MGGGGASEIPLNITWKFVNCMMVNLISIICGLKLSLHVDIHTIPPPPPLHPPPKLYHIQVYVTDLFALWLYPVIS